MPGALPTLLVTGACGPAGRTLGQQLAGRAADGLCLRVVGVDLQSAEVEGYSDIAAVAPAADLAYVTSMRDAITRFAPDVIIPTVQDELPQVATLVDILGRAAAAARPGVRPAEVVTAGAVAAALAADKLLTMWTLSAAGVPVPPHASAADFTSAAEAIDWAGGPIVVKPRVSRGGRGVVLVERPEDIDWDGVGAPHIVQGFAPGEEFAPQTYRSARTGVSQTHVLQKTALKEGRVGNAAEAVRLVDGSEPAIERLAIGAVEALGLVGPVDMDVRLTEAGDPVVLEVNGRFGALSALAPELLSAVLEDHLSR